MGVMVVLKELLESVFKLGDVKVGSAVERAVEMYNETYHSGLKCTPNEAVKDWNKNVEVKWENSSEGEYARYFVKRKRETFEV